jgi:hypothetical protein
MMERIIRARIELYVYMIRFYASPQPKAGLPLKAKARANRNTAIENL